MNTPHPLPASSPSSFDTAVHFRFALAHFGTVCRVGDAPQGSGVGRETASLLTSEVDAAVGAHVAETIVFNERHFTGYPDMF